MHLGQLAIEVAGVPLSEATPIVRSRIVTRPTMLLLAFSILVLAFASGDSLSVSARASSLVNADETAVRIDTGASEILFQCDDGILRVLGDGELIIAVDCVDDLAVEVSGDALTTIVFAAPPPLSSLSVTSQAANGLTLSGAVVVRGDARVDALSITHRGAIAAHNITLISEDGTTLSDGSVLSAPGGSITLQSTNGPVFALAGSIINASPIDEAGSGGPINITAAHIGLAGLVSSINGGEVIVDAPAGLAVLAGVIDVSGIRDGSLGGTVRLLGASVGLVDSSARIIAAGHSGGGTVLVGGDRGGAPPVPTSQETLIVEGAVINVNAIENGNGGRVVIWSDGDTLFDGAITARGGLAGGDGGFVEVSGKITVQVEGEIDVSAPAGSDGETLIDPLFYIVVPDGPFALISYIDDADALAFKSEIISSTGTFLFDFFCGLFSGDCLDDLSGPTLGDYRVLYGNQNSILGLITFVYPPAFPLKFRAPFSVIETGAIELFPGNVSVQSIFGIQFLHGLLDVGIDTNGLAFDQQTPGETVEFHTFFSIYSYGEISIAGADFTLNAGEPFTLDALEDIIIGMIPLGSGIADALDLNDFLHDVDVGAVVLNGILEAVLDPTGPTAGETIAFIDLLCGECVPPILIPMAALISNPIGNVDKIDDLLVGLNLTPDPWVTDLTDTLDLILDWVPANNAAVDWALGGFDTPFVPGIPGVETNEPASCNAGGGFWTGGVGGDCWTVLPFSPTFVSHTHDTTTKFHFCFAIPQSSGHDGCDVGPHTHTGGNRVHFCAGVIVFGSHDCQLLPGFAGTPGIEVDAFTGCNVIVFVSLGVFVDGVCYTTPPIPPFHISGLCELDAVIPCNFHNLVVDLLGPLVRDGIEHTAVLATGHPWTEVINFRLPDSVKIPDFSVDNETPVVLYIDEPITNPDGTITLKNSSIHDDSTVALNARIEAGSVTIEVPGGRIQSTDLDPTVALANIFLPPEWNIQPTGGGLIVSSDIELTAGTGIGLSGGPIALRGAPSTDEVDADIRNLGSGGIFLAAQGSLSLSSASIISNTGTGAIDLTAEDDLTIAAGATVSSAGSLSISVDQGEGDSGGGALSFFGSAFGTVLYLRGNGDGDTINVDASVSTNLPVTIDGRGAFDTLNFNALGLPATHGLTRQILTPGKFPVTHTNVERINGVAPTVEPPLGGSVDEGQLFTRGLSFIDWGADTWQITVDSDDDAPTQVINVGASANGQGPFPAISGFSHVFADNSLHDIEVCIEDVDDGGQTCQTLTFSVNNVAPTVDAGPDQPAAEGGIVSLAPATFSDPGTLDTHTATVDWGDGTPVEAAVVVETPFGPVDPSGPILPLFGTVLSSHVYADDGDFLVEVCVLDDDGAETCDQFTANISNVAPTIEAGPGHSIDEGDLVNVAAIVFTDAGIADTHSVTVDWGDGPAPEPAIVTETPSAPPGSTTPATGTAAASHHYADNGVYEVIITVTDDDGDFASDSFQVVVANVTPTLSSLPDFEVVVFSPLDISSPFSDPGFDCPLCPTAEDFTATVSWGDGPTEPAGVTEVPGGPAIETTGEVSASHIYTEVGFVTVNVTLTDDDGASTEISFEVEVIGARELKNEARRRLELVKGSSKRLQKAINELEKAIDLSLWVDEVHIYPKHGHKVFSHQHHAAQELQGALRDRRSSDIQKAAALDALELMMKADEVLYITLTEDLGDLVATNPRKQRKVDEEITRAANEFALALAERVADDPDKAIQHFRKAWEHLQSAREHAAK